MRRLRLCCLLCCSWMGSAVADLPIDEPRVESLGQPHPHWLLVNEYQAKTRVFDADTGQMLGLLSTTPWTAGVEPNSSRNEIYAPETYYSRGTRGARTDVLSIYSIDHLAFVAEVAIPSGMAAGVPIRSYYGLTTDDRFMLVYNLDATAMSVTVVDVVERRLAAQVPTPGCGLVLPQERAFLQLCADGSYQRVELNERGEEAQRQRSDAFFSVADDPLMEKGARLDAQRYLMPSFAGVGWIIGGQGAPKQIPLTGNATEEKRWRIGGWQPLAVHRAQGVAYLLMHEGGKDTHKEPGSEVWRVDANSGNLVNKIALTTPALAIEVSQDDQPLLYASNPVAQAVEIYDGKTGQLKRVLKEAGVVTLMTSF